jgi:hypothetical protein
MLGVEEMSLRTLGELRELTKGVLPSHLTLKRSFCQLTITLEFRETIRP